MSAKCGKCGKLYSGAYCRECRNKYLRLYRRRRNDKRPDSSVPCKCGCGRYPKLGNVFINTHQLRTDEFKIKTVFNQRTREMQDKISKEFSGRELPEIINEFRSQEYTWETIAGVLGISLRTLYEWRKHFGLEINIRKKIFYKERKLASNSAHLKAQRLGYKNAYEAIRELKLDGLTSLEVAERLGVRRSTVSRLTPSELKGYYNFSEKFYKNKRKQNRVGGNHLWKRFPLNLKRSRRDD